GIVAAASDAFGDVAGLVGGMLITVDFFLTSALSVVIAVHQLRAVLDVNATSVALLAAAGLGVLGALNLIGLKEAARVVAVVAVAALVAQMALVVVTGIRIGGDEWHAVRGQMVGLRAVAPETVFVGFAAAWLAFSGVESIAQLAPILREPQGRTARAAL